MTMKGAWKAHFENRSQGLSNINAIGKALVFGLAVKRP